MIYWIGDGEMTDVRFEILSKNIIRASIHAVDSRIYDEPFANVVEVKLFIATIYEHLRSILMLHSIPWGPYYTLNELSQGLNILSRDTGR